MDREKVIKGLTICNCLSDLCYEHDCPYYNGVQEICGVIEDVGYSSDDCKEKLHADALAMLKEQKHGETFTVIDTKTGKEADEYNIALHEEWARDLCYCDMEGWAIENDGSLLLVDECGRFAYADRERFKVVWDV